MAKQRIQYDRYFTNNGLVQALRRHAAIKGTVFEPCAGDMAIARHFLECITNDLHPLATHPTDFQFDATDQAAWDIDYRGQKLDWVISNPPYNVAPPIVENALTYSKNVAMLLRLSFLEPCANRAELLKEYPLSKLIIFNPRPRFRNDTKGSDNVTVAWFVWVYGNEKTEIIYETDWQVRND